MQDAFRRFQPEVLYVPHMGEAHSDHFYAGLAAERARAACDLQAAVLGYEVWSPIDADVVVDVTETYTLKLDAIRRYATQLEEIDIVRAVDGLNRFRANLIPETSKDRGLWGEVFTRVS